MEFEVSVSFKKARDYSNAYKDTIIFALPGPYRVSRDVLNDMDKCGVHTFRFKTLQAASGFAKELFSRHNNVFDISTSFIVK